ncbi:MAG: PhoH family protein, partial [Bacilli bacterium]|nr:PhoH family protein [Bacilli bacterium]
MSHSLNLFNTYNQNKQIYICDVVLSELDKLKTSSDLNKQFQARQAHKLIKQNKDKITFCLNNKGYKLPDSFDRESNDNKIINIFRDLYLKDDKFLMFSNDLNVQFKCECLELPCMEFCEDEGKQEIYKGYKEIILTQEELAEHYQNPINNFELLINEYLLIKDKNNNIVDKKKWTEKGFKNIGTKPFKSIYFPDFKPRDEYQMFAMDSLINDDLTLLYGKAGSAKTTLSLSWIMQNIHSGKLGKCVVIFNPAKLKNSETLGFYSGNRNEKMLQNSIGGILASKFGSMDLVNTLISNSKLMLIPTSDIRGIEISEHDCIYLSEAQNTDAYTMRTIIQRAKEGDRKSTRL